MKNLRKNKELGITLIALVVTIIVILILAGVTISMALGSEGLIQRTKDVSTKTEIAKEKEILGLAVSGAMTNKYGEIDEDAFITELENNNARAIKMGSKYKVTFPSERQYIVNQSGNVKEKNSNVLEIEELNENGSTYFGWDVINYAETLPSNLQDTKWQLFYAGALDGETEERIYLISKEYVKNSVLPAVIKNGAEIETAKPISGNNEYKACFGNNTSDGIMPHYVGSADISTEIKKYNKDYFKDYTSASPNMKAVAYMLDTTTWSAFATSTKSYAEYAMGGPSIELFLIAYNKYSGTNYKSDAVSNKGYQVSETPSSTFNNSMTMGIIPDVTTGEKLEDNPFSVSSIRDVADGYWLASPSNANSNIIMFITNRGDIFTSLNWYNREYSYAGFRISSYSSIRFKLFIRKGKRFKWK